MASGRNGATGSVREAASRGGDEANDDWGEGRISIPEADALAARFKAPWEDDEDGDDSWGAPAPDSGAIELTRAAVPPVPSQSAPPPSAPPAASPPVFGGAEAIAADPTAPASIAIPSAPPAVASSPTAAAQPATSASPAASTPRDPFAPLTAAPMVPTAAAEHPLPPTVSAEPVVAPPRDPFAPVQPVGQHRAPSSDLGLTRRAAPVASSDLSDEIAFPRRKSKRGMFLGLLVIALVVGLGAYAMLPLSGPSGTHAFGTENSKGGSIAAPSAAATAAEAETALEAAEPAAAETGAERTTDTASPSEIEPEIAQAEAAADTETAADTHPGGAEEQAPQRRATSRRSQRRQAASRSAPRAASDATVRVRIRTIPRSAVLTVDGTRVANPYDAHLTRSQVAHRVEAAAPGHQPRKVSMRFDKDLRETLRLRRARPSAEQRAVQQRAARPPPPTPAERSGAGAGFVTENPY